MHKLGLRNATEMTLAAMEMGLIERPMCFSRLAETHGQAQDIDSVWGTIQSNDTFRHGDLAGIKGLPSPRPP
jgi:hypothetical protein